MPKIQTEFRVTRLALLSCTCLMAIAVAGPAVHAQDAEATEAQDEDQETEEFNRSEIEEIVVTARRRPETQLDIPSSSIAFSETDAETFRLNELDDFVDLAANVSLNTNQFTGKLDPQIRGVPNPPNTIQFEQSVATYRNGFFLASAGLRGGQLIDINTVEILRGPQGGLFGRNAVGGVLNVVFNRPDFDAFSAHVEGGVESYQRVESWGSINLPVNDSFAVRGTGWWTRQFDSETENVPLDEGLNEGTEGGFRLQARIRPLMGAITWDTNVELEYSVNEIALAVDTGTVTQNLFASLFGVGPSVSRTNTLDEVFFNRPSEREDETLFASVESVIDGSFGSVTLAVSYTDFDGFTSRDQDFTDFDPAEIPGVFDARNIVGSESEDLFAELRYTSPSDNRWRIQTGLSYLHQDTLQDGAQPFNVDIPDPIEGFIGLPVLGVLSADAMFDFEQELNSWAVYLEGAYDLTDRLTVEVAGRYTEDEKDAVLSQGVDGDFNLVALFGTNLPTLRVEAEDTFENFSWSGSVSYAIRDNIRTFFSVSEGFRAGGVNEIAGSSEDATYGPETTVGYQGGIKTRWFNNRLALDATVFYQTFDDVLLFIMDEDRPDIQFAINAGESDSLGFDASMRWSPIDRLSVQASLGYVDAEFTDVSERAAMAGAVEGNRPAGIPEWTLTGAATYDQPLGDSGFNGTLSVNGTYATGEFNDLSNDPTEDAGDVFLLDITAGIETGNYRLVGFVDNALDERQIVQFSPAGAFATGTLTRQTQGRIFGVRFFADF